MAIDSSTIGLSILLNCLFNTRRPHIRKEPVAKPLSLPSINTSLSVFKTPDYKNTTTLKIVSDTGTEVLHLTRRRP